MIELDGKTQHDRTLVRERERIARAMHDDLAQYLTALSLHSKAISRVSENEEVLIHTNEINNLIKNSRLNIKHIIWNLLNKDTNENELLIVKIRKLLDYWNLAEERVEQKFETSGHINNLSDVIASVSYKVIQESITNIYRHANASFFKLTLANDGHYSNIIVQDNGIGFNEMRTRYSDGINGMRVRLESVGGSLDIDSKLGSGTSLYMKIPLSRDMIQ